MRLRMRLTAALLLHEDGSVTMDMAGEHYQPIRVYWFAWFTFHPETELFRWQSPLRGGDARQKDYA